MVRIGIVGLGFMGMIHYLAGQKVKGGKVVAIQTQTQKSSLVTGQAFVAISRTSRCGDGSE